MKGITKGKFTDFCLLIDCGDFIEEGVEIFHCFKHIFYMDDIFKDQVTNLIIIMEKIF